MVKSGFDMKVEHPGKKIEALLKATGMSRKELAVRTTVTEKHINTLIAGEKKITTSYARKLGYVFDGMDAAAWQKLQNDYDMAQAEEKELNSISDVELGILKNLDEVFKYLVRYHNLRKTNNPVEKVMELRKKLKISDLAFIPHISYNAAYRAQLTSNVRVDPYVLFAWQSICEIETSDIKISSALNVERLKDQLEKIKTLMFDGINEGIQKLQDILSGCGIAFNVVRNFRGAPVQGFIKHVTDNKYSQKLILCLTLRRSRADTFWFTLFHEIAHILNGDYTAKFVDFDSANSAAEIKADKFARDFLIPPEEYMSFIQEHHDIRWVDIEQFAEQIKVKPFIVLGRLQKDQILDWSDYGDHVDMYKWVNREN